MRFLILAMLLAGAVATPNVDQTVHASRRSRAQVSNFLGGFHYNWVSTKRSLKKKDTVPECEEHHRRWHLPGIEHRSDVEKAYDDKLDKVKVKEASNKKNFKKKETVAECEERHRCLHLPGIEHCSDIDDAFDSLE